MPNLSTQSIVKMKISNLAAAAGLIMSVLLNPAWADGTSETRQTESTTISIAGHEVPVVKGGLYDRYRSNPPLSVIASEAPDVDLSLVQGTQEGESEYWL